MIGEIIGDFPMVHKNHKFLARFHSLRKVVGDGPAGQALVVREFAISHSN